MLKYQLATASGKTASTKYEYTNRKKSYTKYGFPYPLQDEDGMDDKTGNRHLPRRRFSEDTNTTVEIICENENDPSGTRTHDL